MIFISHSSHDKEKAIKLTRLLKSHGINYWIDHENILPGDNIMAKIRDGLDKSNVLIFLISKNSSNSPWCSFEYENVLYKVFKEFNKEFKLNWFERLFLNTQQQFKRMLKKMEKKSMKEKDRSDEERN